jgi:Acetyl-CoA hydrolase/transferase N-terminal domain
MLEDRIRRPSLMDRIVSPEVAASLIRDGMIIGMSGFTRAGDAKAVPLAMAARAKTDPFQITLLTGASLGHDIDRMLTEAHVLARRMPFQTDATLRAAINRGEVMFIDQHHRLRHHRGCCDPGRWRHHSLHLHRQFRKLCDPCQEDHHRDQPVAVARSRRPARHLHPDETSDARGHSGGRLRYARRLALYPC